MNNKMNLYELRKIAKRQQEYIESQQEFILSKEQRLKYLKQAAANNKINEHQTKVDMLRESVSTQEARLRQLHALRGQMMQIKSNNRATNDEIESIRALFTAKEKELSLSLAKVEALTKQLEQLKNGFTNDCYNVNNILNKSNNKYAKQLDTLRQELASRNKLNEQQNSESIAKQKLLMQRKCEISSIDERMNELQARLVRKRIMNSQLSSQLSSKLNSHLSRSGIAFGLTGGNSIRSSLGARKLSRTLNNVATVEPLQRTTQSPEKRTPEYIEDCIDNDDKQYFCKYQTLPYNTKFSGERYEDKLIPTTSSQSSSILSEDKNMPKEEENKIDNDLQNKKEKITSNEKRKLPLIVPPVFNLNDGLRRFKQMIPSKPIPPPRQTYDRGRNNNGDVNLIDDKCVNVKSNINISIYDKKSSKPNCQSISNDKLDQDVCNSSIDLLQERMKLYSSNSESKFIYDENNKKDEKDEQVEKDEKDEQDEKNEKENKQEKETSETLSSEQNTFYKNDYRNEDYQSINDKSILNKLFDSNINHSGNFENYLDEKDTTEYKISSEQTKLEFEKSALNNSLEKITDKNESFQQESGDIQESNESQTDETNLAINIDDMIDGTNWSNDYSKQLRKPLIGKECPVRRSDNAFNSIYTIEYKKEAAIDDDFERFLDEENDQVPEYSNDWNRKRRPVVDIDRELDGTESDDNIDNEAVDILVVEKKELTRSKSNLKSESKDKEDKINRRVTFDPLALLYDAALQGELELVKKTAAKVPNPGAPNNEGITALHNTIYGGHFEIVKYLIEIGCDVNASDAEGWTPLHCAASINNLTMVKYLVENGSCIFATTFLDKQTPAEKCEKGEGGFEECSKYLFNIQEKLGIMNNGEVFAVYDYDAQNNDELSFKDGDLMVVLKREDQEYEWFWAKKDDKEGYIPRNLLGLYPRFECKKLEE